MKYLNQLIRCLVWYTPHIGMFEGLSSGDPF